VRGVEGQYTGRGVLGWPSPSTHTHAATTSTSGVSRVNVAVHSSRLRDVSSVWVGGFNLIESLHT
jgi:hypothetical protein